MLWWNQRGGSWLPSAIALAVTFISFDFCSAIECNLYIAESTIPNAGLGIFSGIELNAGDPVGYEDVSIPIFNFTPVAMHDYVWAGEVMGMKLEAAPALIEAKSPGLDSIVNCNLALINVARAKMRYDDSGLHRSRDPAAGSTTPYHSGVTTTTRKVPVGGELFKHYGNEWFNGRPDLFGEHFPRAEDFAAAQDIIDDAFSFGEHLGRNIVEEIIFPMQRIWNSGTLNALPKTIEEAIIAFREEIEMVYQPSATRSVDWLKENGKCADNISPKQSTIEGAGRGAFATRDLPKGTIITGSPLHHIPIKDDFIHLFRTVPNDNPDEEPRSEVSGQQIQLNYCFGHAESTLLLCPYGAGISYINHNQTRANLKVQWPKDGFKPHDETWFQKQPEEMVEISSAHLVFDYVATQNISAGEELFLDYGDEWEVAWNEHAAKWKLERIWSSSYISAKRWNEKVAGIPLRTSVETASDPYPANLHIRCHSDLEEKEWGSFDEWPQSEYGYPCEIKERKKDAQSQDIVYSVRLVTEKYDRWDTEFESSRVLDIDGVPRSAIRFFDVPFTTDLHLRGAFRHPIGIPEAIMPRAWKNVPATCASVSEDGHSDVCLP